MPVGAVKVEGLKELDRGLRDYDKELRKREKAWIKGGAEIVAVDARSKAERYGARTAAGLKAGIRGTTGIVRQSIGGKRIRPVFGSVLMRYALLPAVEEKQDAVVAYIESGLDLLGRDAGF